MPADPLMSRIARGPVSAGEKRVQGGQSVFAFRIRKEIHERKNDIGRNFRGAREAASLFGSERSPIELVGCVTSVASSRLRQH